MHCMKLHRCESSWYQSYRIPPERCYYALNSLGSVKHNFLYTVTDENMKLFLYYYCASSSGPWDNFYCSISSTLFCYKEEKEGPWERKQPPPDKNIDSSLDYMTLWDVILSLLL